MITLPLATCASAISLNLSLINDLVRSGEDVGTAAGFITAVGNLFGLLAPIATGYFVASTGGFAMAFTVVGPLLIVGAVLSVFGATRPVEQAARLARFFYSFTQGNLVPFFDVETRSYEYHKKYPR